MARDVVPLRLSESEKAAVAKGAAGLGVTVSEFLRQAALAAAHRLAEARRPKMQERKPAVAQPRPPQATAPPVAVAVPHVVTTYRSFDEYRNRDSLGSGGGQFRFDLAGDE